MSVCRYKTGVIVDQNAVSERFTGGCGRDTAEAWISEGYHDFSATLANPNFPCLFGRSAHKRRSLKFLFVSREHHVDDLVRGMCAYTAFVQAVPLEDRIYSPLVVIFEEVGFDTLQAEHVFCWDQLRILHENDPRLWPSEIPRDPHHSGWTFCFDGEQLFFNMSCPKHALLRSRRLGRRVTFIVNPRVVSTMTGLYPLNSAFSVRLEISNGDNTNSTNRRCRL